VNEEIPDEVRGRPFQAGRSLPNTTDSYIFPPGNTLLSGGRMIPKAGWYDLTINGYRKIANYI
jgi:hypothetical protein